MVETTNQLYLWWNVPCFSHVFPWFSQQTQPPHGAKLGDSQGRHPPGAWSSLPRAAANCSSMLRCIASQSWRAKGARSRRWTKKQWVLYSIHVLLMNIIMNIIMHIIIIVIIINDIYIIVFMLMIIPCKTYVQQKHWFIVIYIYIYIIYIYMKKLVLYGLYVLFIHFHQWFYGPVKQIYIYIIYIPWNSDL
jgi:hypothetical protein